MGVMHACAARRSKAVDQALALRRLQPENERELTIEKLVEDAKKIDQFVRSMRDE